MTTPDHEKSSRLLFFIILAIIVASLAAFLIVRPHPSAGPGAQPMSSPAVPRK